MTFLLQHLLQEQISGGIDSWSFFSVITEIPPEDGEESFEVELVISRKIKST